MCSYFARAKIFKLDQYPGDGRVDSRRRRMIGFTRRCAARAGTGAGDYRGRSYDSLLRGGIMARTPDLAGALEAVVARTLKGTIGPRLRRLEGQLRRLDRRLR